MDNTCLKITVETAADSSKHNARSTPMFKIASNIQHHRYSARQMLTTNGPSVTMNPSQNKNTFNNTVELSCWKNLASLRKNNPTTYYWAPNKFPNSKKQPIWESSFMSVVRRKRKLIALISANTTLKKDPLKIVNTRTFHASAIQDKNNHTQYTYESSNFSNYHNKAVTVLALFFNP